MRSSIGDALRLHLGELGLLELVGLLQEDDVRVLEDGLDHGDEVERVGFALGIERAHGLDEVERERVVEREVALQALAHLDVLPGAVVVRHGVDDPGVAQRAEEAEL